MSFTVQGFRVAVDPATGEIRVLQSVQAVDAGTVLNPVQLRGQVEGGVAQALGAALFEEVGLDADGAVTTRALREYHVPVLADVPRDRGAVRRRDARPVRPARGQADERGAVQPGRAGPGQRGARRDRGPADRAAAAAGTRFYGALNRHRRH